VGNQGNTRQEKKLLKQALKHCFYHADAHNNLASLLENEGDYEQAIYHYKQALQIDPNLSFAWYGLGETYYKQGQFPLSLEAHLHTCKTDEDSKKRLIELLKENRYAVTEEGQILNKESLLLLYNKQRQQTISRMISDCGLRSNVESKGTFRNVTFHTGSAKLTRSAKQQIKNLAEAFKQIMPSVIKVYGHTDNQQFKRAKTQAENDHLNLKLSQQRALAVKKELIEQGIKSKRIQTWGYGSKKPLDKSLSKIAYAKNRRVEIESVN